MARRPAARAEDDSENERRRIESRLRALVGKLDKIAQEQVAKKSLIEERWYDDLRYYHGRYDAQTEARLKLAKKSRLFVNLARTKTHAWQARLSDMLFPTDDKNWGIKPTPVPDLVTQGRAAGEAARQMAAKANEALASGDRAAADAIAEQGNRTVAPAAAQANEQQETAKRHAEAMEREIDDQLRESRYNVKAREVIADACRLGVGVIKGPLVHNRSRAGWRKGADGLHHIEHRGDPRPTFERVDPWSYFPDMGARTPAEAEFHFERHLKKPKDLRKLARVPGFDAEAIRRLLRDGAREGRPTYIATLRDITSGGQDTGDDYYQVWEYHGPLEPEEIRDLAIARMKEDDRDELLHEIAEVDPLAEVNVVVWFCQGEVLKFGEAQLESGDAPYSAFSFERDDTSIFGFGVPYLMRDSQAALNAAWRAMMDNAGRGAGPQVVVNKDLVEPQDGVWETAPWKVWLAKSGAATGQAGLNAAFGLFHMEPRQEQFAAIIEFARRFADDETNMPLIAQGDQASHITQTAQGMAILMNSVNVVFRRVVKNFDDDVTEPIIRRAYDWNMQFSAKEEIKGDMEVDARGSSVLLVREIQAQNLMAMAMNFTAHPVLGPLLKIAPLMRKLAQAHMLSAADVIKTDEEIRLEAEEAQRNPPPPDPEMLKLQLQKDLAQMEAEVRVKIADIGFQTAMARLAQESNMSLEQLRATLADHREERESKERALVAEAALQERASAQAASREQQPPKGGGGSL